MNDGGEETTVSKALAKIEGATFEESGLELAAFVTNLAGVAVPGVGLLGSFFTSVQKKRSGEREEEFRAAVATELISHREAISKSVPFDKFEALFTHAQFKVREEYRQEKIDSYRRFLISVAVDEDLSDDFTDLLVSTLDGMTSLHLKVFALIIEVEDANCSPENFKRIVATKPAGMVGKRLDVYLSDQFGMNTVQVEIIVNQLTAAGLLRRANDVLRAAYVFLEEHSNLLNDLVTEYGRHFEEKVLRERIKSL